MFTYTNADVDRLNASLRAVMRDSGRLGEDHQFTTKHGRAAFAAGDRLQITGTDKNLGLFNGTAGTITAIKDGKITLARDGQKNDRVTLDPAVFQDFRHGYAGTIYKAQGRTLDKTYLYHSDHWRSSSGYVALTRHRESTALFVARNSLDIRPQPEAWMMQSGGAAALTSEHHESAQRSFESWAKDNPGPAERYGFESYVSYVQQQWAREGKQQQDAAPGTPELRALARQMARTDERRAASQFHTAQELGPVRPLTADEINVRFASRGPRDEGRSDPATLQGQRDAAAIKERDPAAGGQGPASRIEAAVADALRLTKTGTEFAAALDAGGLRIARITAADLSAVDEQRKRDEFAAATGGQLSGKHLPRRLAIDDLVAVTKNGHVLPLSPRQVDYSEIAYRLSESEPRMPSMVEARAHHDAVHNEKADRREKHRAENAERQRETVSRARPLAGTPPRGRHWQSAATQ